MTLLPVCLIGILAMAAKTSCQVTSSSNALNLTELSARISALEASLASTFVRWGRTTCPNGTEKIYQGVMGGSYYNHTGRAVTNLCLTTLPVYDNQRAPSNWLAHLYGTEYDGIPGHNSQNGVCALCRVTKPTTIMMATTNHCPSGWTEQYNGYLVAAPRADQASEYICLNKYPEDGFGGHRNQEGNVLYLTVTKCGSLPCPPFKENGVVTCVVCSK